MKEKIRSDQSAEKKGNGSLKIMKVFILMLFVGSFTIMAENVYHQQKSLLAYSPDEKITSGK